MQINAFINTSTLHDSIKKFHYSHVAPLSIISLVQEVGSKIKRQM